MRSGISIASFRPQYLQALIAGDRPAAREILSAVREAGFEAREVLCQLIAPVMVQLRELHREERISVLELNTAARLNRAMADQAGASLQMQPRNGKRVLVVCGNAEPEELGGQICADLFEAAGHEVVFVGGSVPDDEVLALVGRYRPELLMLYATLPSQLPGARKLIDYLHEVNCCPELRILCCGGVYQRAEGLADEIGADLYAADAEAALEITQSSGQQRATLEQQTVGRSRRIKKAAQRRALMAAKAALRNVKRQAA